MGHYETYRNNTFTRKTRAKRAFFRFPAHIPSSATIIFSERPREKSVAYTRPFGGKTILHLVVVYASFGPTADTECIWWPSPESLDIVVSAKLVRFIITCVAGTESRTRFTF